MNKSKALRGYQARDSGTHRQYDFNTSVRFRKKTGFFKTRSSGAGHRAGYNWGEKKNIEPRSRVTKYSKNSPSFDEGVWEYKQSRKNALQTKMK